MDKLESDLEQLSLTPAPEGLNRRVAETLDARRGVPLWAYAAACVALLLAGVFLRPEPAPRPPEPLVYTVDAGPDFAAVFAPKREASEFFARKKQVIDTQPMQEDF